jgi:predicted nucleotidyltransferase
MKTEWPPQATPQQRAAVTDYAQRLLAKYGSRILRLTLFGSVARGDFAPYSDIDVLVVADEVSPDFKASVRKISYAVSLDRDVVLNVHVKARARWEAMRAKGEALWRNVERDGVDLFPQPIAA